MGVTQPERAPLDQLALEAAPTVSKHNLPQPSPQEWDCGCVTAVYITDEDALRGGMPFQMRLTHRCGKRTCLLRWEVAPSLGALYRSVNNKAGRRWRLADDDSIGRSSTLVRIGGDWGAAGGVKAIRVPWDRPYDPRIWERLS